MGVRIPPPVLNTIYKMANNIFTYISESFEELKSNVTWPEWSEIQKLTVIVAVFSLLFALATFGVDLAFEKALAGFFNFIKG
jgi:preprotein translocase subunit SecE